MSPHARRVLLLRAALAALTLALPAAAAIDAARAAWRGLRHGPPCPPCPGLYPDGDELEPWEKAALIGIRRGLRQPAERSQP